MPKNIVICCAGMNNQFGSSKTDVGRLCQALTLHYATQLENMPSINEQLSPGDLNSRSSQSEAQEKRT